MIYRTNWLEREEKGCKIRKTWDFIGYKKNKIVRLEKNIRLTINKKEISINLFQIGWKKNGVIMTKKDILLIEK